MPALDIIASIASTVMSTVVATVALVFTYRQNVGWKPVALVTKTTLTGMDHNWRMKLYLSVEVWNRRKFPIALRSARAKISGVEILNEDPIGRDSRDYVRNNTAFKELNVMIEPNGSEGIKFEVSFEEQSLDALRPLFDMTFTYFNPHRNRNETLTLKCKVFYPNLGWAKSEEQVAKIIKVFEDMRVHENAFRESAQEKEQMRVTPTATLKGGVEADTGD